MAAGALEAASWQTVATWTRPPWRGGWGWGGRPRSSASRRKEVQRGALTLRFTHSTRNQPQRSQIHSPPIFSHCPPPLHPHLPLWFPSPLGTARQVPSQGLPHTRCSSRWGLRSPWAPGTEGPQVWLGPELGEAWACRPGNQWGHSGRLSMRAADRIHGTESLAAQHAAECSGHRTHWQPGLPFNRPSASRHLSLRWTRGSGSRRTTGS